MYIFVENGVDTPSQIPKQGVNRKQVIASKQRTGNAVVCKHTHTRIFNYKKVKQVERLELRKQQRFVFKFVFLLNNKTNVGCCFGVNIGYINLYAITRDSLKCKFVVFTFGYHSNRTT